MLENREHEDLGTVILNTETNKFVMGFIASDWVEFTIFNASEIVEPDNYDTNAAFNSYVLERHTELVSELEQGGYGVTFS